MPPENSGWGEYKKFVLQQFKNLTTYNERSREDFLASQRQLRIDFKEDMAQVRTDFHEKMEDMEVKVKDTEDGLHIVQTEKIPELEVAQGKMEVKSGLWGALGAGVVLLVPLLLPWIWKTFVR